MVNVQSSFFWGFFPEKPETLMIAVTDCSILACFAQMSHIGGAAAPSATGVTAIAGPASLLGSALPWHIALCTIPVNGWHRSEERRVGEEGLAPL